MQAQRVAEDPRIRACGFVSDYGSSSTACGPQKAGAYGDSSKTDERCCCGVSKDRVYMPRPYRLSSCCIRRSLLTNNPEFAAILPHLPPRAPPVEDIAVVREGFNGLITAFKRHFEPKLPASSAYRAQDRKVPVDRGDITVRCIVPVGEQKSFPVLVWFHGGGYAVGNLELDDYRLKIMAVELQVAVVNVDYRLAPEHVWPVPWEDCYAATKWVVENASLLSGALEKGFIVGGSSAGGNLAAFVSQRARDDSFFSKTPITGQWLQCPTTIHPEADPGKFKNELLSMDQNKDAPLLTRETIFDIARRVGAPPGNSTEPGWSVLLNPSLTGLPVAYMQVAGLDPLRDEALLYGKLLEKAGVKTKIDIYAGFPHAFNYVFPHLEKAAQVEKDADNGVRWLLRQVA